MDIYTVDVKPSINTIVDAVDVKSEIALPIKMGEIFRNSNQQYSFMCFHCGSIFEEFNKIIDHCEDHYHQEEKYDPIGQLSDFVCAESETVFNPNLSAPLDIAQPEPMVMKIESQIPNGIDSVQKQKQKQKRKRQPRQPEVKPIEPNTSQDCAICEVWCDDYRSHLKNVHNFGYTVYQCYMCKKFFKSAKRLISHMSAWNHITNHCYQCEMEPPIKHSTEPRRHKCQFCKEWFSNHVEFKIHFRDAHNEDADYFFHKRKNCNCFTCYICEREFPLRFYLASHMRIHSDKYLCHTCPTCGRRLRTYGQLTQHLKTHEGKIFSCDKCDKKFAHYARLRIHQSSHITELNFMCDVCPKKFKKRMYLQRHKAVHTNERKYKCKFCDSSFNFTSARRAHEKGLHGAL